MKDFIGILKSIEVYNDRVLMIPHKPKNSGIILVPDSAGENESVLSAMVVKKGNGYMIPTSSDSQPWEKSGNKITAQFIPISVSMGDFVYYIESKSIKIRHEGFDFIVCPESAIIMAITNNASIDSILAGISGTVSQ